MLRSRWYSLLLIGCWLGGTSHAQPPTVPQPPTIAPPSSSVPPLATPAEATDDGPVAAGQDETGEQEGTRISGKISRVTLYRDRALVSRDIPVEANGGSDVLTITALPEQLIPGSVFAEGDENIQVRAVEVSSRTTTNSSRTVVRELEAEIEELEDAKMASASELELLQANLQTVEQVVNFTAEKTSDDLNRGTLDPKAVTELTKFVTTTRLENLASQLELSKRTRVIEKQLAEKRTELSQLVASDYRQLIEAKIFIDRQPGATGTIKLNYLVDGCQWNPRYAVRGTTDGNQFTIRYSAMVQQISGEDWSNVALTLSTASPSVSATGPELTPFRISAVNNGQQQMAQQGYGNFSNDAKQMAERMNSLRAQQRSVENKVTKKAVDNSPVERDVALNVLAGQIQELELAVDPNAASRIAADAADEVASQVYSLDKPVTLQSRRQQQLVRIAELELEGQLYHVATPLLSSYAYRHAEMTNKSSIGLLGGSADVYLNDRFVGVTELPTTASGQRLLVGFGADQQVRTRRELRTKNDTIRGGNRSLEFTYRLVIANFKNQPVNVRLYDRIPISNESRDVAVNLQEPAIPLSDDVLYKRLSKDRGILRWDLDIPADSHADTVFDVEYTYSLEFDRSRTLTTQELEQSVQIDLFEGNQAMPGMGGGMGGMGGMGGATGNGGSTQIPDAYGDPFGPPQP